MIPEAAVKKLDLMYTFLYHITIIIIQHDTVFFMQERYNNIYFCGTGL